MRSEGSAGLSQGARERPHFEPDEGQCDGFRRVSADTPVNGDLPVAGHHVDQPSPAVIQIDGPGKERYAMNVEREVHDLSICRRNDFDRSQRARKPG
jgi:hypothetical protein